MTTSDSTLKVSIEGRTLLKIRDIYVPVNPYLSAYNMNVNLVGFYLWCKICEGRRAFYFCETEGIYVCPGCNGFCESKAHSWKDLSCQRKRTSP